MSRAKRNVIIISSVLLASIVGGAVAGVRFFSQSKETPNEPQSTAYTSVTEYTFSEESAEDWSSTVILNGKTYSRKADIKTILFLGVDREVDSDYKEVAGGGGCADTIMLMFADESNKTIDILEISRDTITEVDVYNFDRDYLYSGDMQLCLQYSFSDSSKRGSLLTRDTVSQLLFGTQIDSYCSLTTKGLTDIVDSIGGIEITFDEDYSYINPEYTKGATSKMDSKAVDTFVRYRDTDTLGSNNDRMSRQAWLIMELIGSINNGTFPITELYTAAGNELCSDMDAETMAQFSDYSINSIKTMPGDSKEGELHDEFYPDMIALRELLIGYLYEET
ncbi:MAG: LCP family protein [Clostridia bacterium]|nr:LCP family protein [Clostridia bacterium]